MRKPSVGHGARFAMRGVRQDSKRREQQEDWPMSPHVEQIRPHFKSSDLRYERLSWTRTAIRKFSWASRRGIAGCCRCWWPPAPHQRHAAHHLRWHLRLSGLPRHGHENYPKRFGAGQYDERDGEISYLLVPVPPRVADEFDTLHAVVGSADD